MAIDMKERRNSLGASEWSQVLGLSPFGDSYQVFARKTGLQDSSFATARMADGNDSEDFVLNLAEKRLPLRQGTRLVGKQVKITHHADTWLTATLDAIADLIVDGQPVSAVIEAKTISTPIYNKIPEYYLIQVLAQMYCTGLNLGYLVVWSTKDTEFRAFPVRMEDHREWFEECYAKVRHFWFENVVKNIAPEKKEILREKEVTLADELMEEYLEAQEQEKLHKDRKDEAKKKIIEALGNPTEYRAKDHRYQIDLTTTTSKRLDTDKLKSEKGDLVAPYFSETSSQRLVVKRIGLKMLAS